MTLRCCETFTLITSSHNWRENRRLPTNVSGRPYEPNGYRRKPQNATPLTATETSERTALALRRFSHRSLTVGCFAVVVRQSLVSLREVNIWSPAWTPVDRNTTGGTTLVSRPRFELPKSIKNRWNLHTHQKDKCTASMHIFFVFGYRSGWNCNSPVTVCTLPIYLVWKSILKSNKQCYGCS